MTQTVTMTGHKWGGGQLLLKQKSDEELAELGKGKGRDGV